MKARLGEAYAQYRNGILDVYTGTMSRKWEWRENGFATIEMAHMETGVVYHGGNNCDYNVFNPNLCKKAELRSLNARVADEANTSAHIEVTAIMTYPEQLLCVKYVIWVYPNAPGLRTQLFIKAIDRYTPISDSSDWVAETITFPQASRIKAVGYYNDTQHRNMPETEIIKEEEYTGQGNLQVDWASIFALYNGSGGLCVVKESNKCVNQSAYETGAFVYKDEILKITGLGLSPGDIRKDRYLFAWAVWTILFDGEDDGLETAVKAFDRLRFPIDKDRDIYIMANTWGTGSDTRACDNACGELVLKDIAVAAEIGVDVLQVDAGWHSPMGTEGFALDLPWYTHKEKYPNGWEMITVPARKHGLELGLWFSWCASADEMIDNMNQGDFKYFKIDFADLTTRECLDALCDKAHRVCAAGGGDVRINWDVTENDSRMGYYFGREFGNIYLENRKPYHPKEVVYIPFLVLRDAWQVAKYTSLNKFQVTLQNLDLINTKASDACLHNLPYCAMIAFMGAPILFQQVQFLSEKAKGELKDIIAIYKKHRGKMFDCTVYPIGEKPDNRSWTGFQFDNGGNGYIALFRELNNNSNTESIKLKFLRECNLAATDVITGEQRTISVGKDGCASFDIADPCGFVWYEYAAAL